MIAGSRTRRAIAEVDRSPPRHAPVHPRLGLAGVRETAGDDDYVGLVTDDVDDTRGELVKLRATVNGHVPSARRELALVAVVVAGLVLSEAVLSAKATGR